MRDPRTDGAFRIRHRTRRTGGTAIIRRLVTEFEYIHTALGIGGNVLFVVGSILFFERFSEYHTLAVWCFVVGSALMLVGAVGSGLKNLWQAEHETSS